MKSFLLFSVLSFAIGLPLKAFENIQQPPAPSEPDGIIGGHEYVDLGLPSGTKCSEPIISYEYDNEKGCSSEDTAKTISRYFKYPYTFLSSGMGGARIMVRGSDGKFRNSSDIEEQSIPYKPLEIK